MHSTRRSWVVQATKGREGLGVRFPGFWNFRRRSFGYFPGSKGPRELTKIRFQLLKNQEITRRLAIKPIPNLSGKLLLPLNLPRPGKKNLVEFPIPLVRPWPFSFQFLSIPHHLGFLKAIVAQEIPKAFLLLNSTLTKRVWQGGLLQKTRFQKLRRNVMVRESCSTLKGILNQFQQF